MTGQSVTGRVRLMHREDTFEYLVAVQRYHHLVEVKPEEWMPWNHADDLRGLQLVE
jgi:hypothetical protein